MTVRTLDFNSDCGERYANRRPGDPAAVPSGISSADAACVLHASGVATAAPGAGGGA